MVGRWLLTVRTSPARENMHLIKIIRTRTNPIPSPQCHSIWWHRWYSSDQMMTNLDSQPPPPLTSRIPNAKHWISVTDWMRITSVESVIVWTAWITWIGSALNCSQQVCWALKAGDVSSAAGLLLNDSAHGAFLRVLMYIVRFSFLFCFFSGHFMRLKMQTKWRETN